MTKKIYMMAIVTATVICVLFGIIKHNEKSGLRLDGKTILNGSDEKARENSEKVSTGEFSDIKIDAKILDVHIQSGNEVAVSFNCTDGLEPDIKVEDGKLIVNQKDKRKVKTGNSEADIFITIPEKTQIEESIIRTDVGEIRIEGISIKESKLTTNVGDVIIENADIIDAEIDTDVGDARIKKSKILGLVIDTDTGDIKLERCEFNNIKATSDVGDIEVESNKSVSDYDIELKAGIGDVKYNNERFDKHYEKNGSSDYKIELRSSVGDVKLED